MINYEEQIAKKLQKIDENKLTRDIIIPLLESIGFHKVEFFGGPGENGKDIIFWEFNKFGKLKLNLAQVKHFKFTNKAADSKSLMGVVNQIGQCFNNNLPYSDKSFHAPSEVYLITTYPVDTDALLSRFNSFQTLKDQHITIIDGNGLSKLILEKKPEFIRTILGLELDIINKTQPTLNNKILLSALGFHEEKDIKSIYTDIDFSLGRVSTELFFHSKFNPSVRKLKLNPTDVVALKEVLTKLTGEYKLNFTKTSIEDLIRRLPSPDEVKAEAKMKASLEAKIESALQATSKIEKLYFAKRTELDDYKREHINYKTEDAFVILQKASNLLSTDLRQQKAIVKALEDEVSKLTSGNNRTIMEFEIDGSPLQSQILDKRNWIETTVAEFNKKEPGVKELGDFLIRCNSIINASSAIFKNVRFFNCLGIDNSKTIRKDFETTRFKLSIDKVFDTGLNFAVLGEAGAGKTTCLQMYFNNRENHGDKLIFSIPLSRLIQNIQNLGKLNLTLNETDFERYIVFYLNSIGIELSFSDFLIVLKTRQTVFLFDGIDEAIKPAPWLLNEIDKLSQKYKPHIQVIATSRMSGGYLDEISFFGITLLPFTAAQRNKFIANWFAEEADKTAINKIERHLKNNSAIATVITNPLLATTLCVLAKHKLRLPNTEIKLYNDRIKLLTGHYDNTKNIVSRITVTPHTLELMAQKIAFYLHSQNKRQDHIPALQAKIKEISNYEVDEDEGRIAIVELADPCNLLVPMTEDGKFGFDHLRYQEHLCAKELFSNRDIDIIPLLRVEWWNGVLILLAGMAQSLKWLIVLLGDRQSCSYHEDILKKMIEVRPKLEQIQLLDLLEKYILLEDQDIFEEGEIDANDLAILNGINNPNIFNERD